MSRIDEEVMSVIAYRDKVIADMREVLTEWESLPLPISDEGRVRVSSLSSAMRAMANYILKGKQRYNRKCSACVEDSLGKITDAYVESGFVCAYHIAQKIDVSEGL